MTESKNRVAIYIRVSTLHQIDKDSLPMQRKDLLNYAKLILNTEDCVVFEDAGYSGKNTDRPAFQDMMSKVRAGMFTHILVWKIDRISRDLLDFARMYSELKRLGVTFVSKNEQFDTSTAMGEAMLKIILVFAELERNMTSERVTAAMIHRASDGLWNGGRVPFGYRYDSDDMTFSIIDSEADIIREIHDRYEDVRSLVTVARYLNSHGMRPRSGAMWSPNTVRLIIRNVFNCGDYRYNMLLGGNRQQPKDESEWITVTDHHPAIVSREQKERCVAILEENARLTKERGLYSNHKHIHIFGGILICGECGNTMHPTISNTDRKHTYSKYLCHTSRKSSSCTAQSTSDPVVGEIFFNFILNMLNAQKRADEIDAIEDLQKSLLIGQTFSYIDSIEPDGLSDMLNLIKSGSINRNVYGKDAPDQTEESETELASLLRHKQQIERALDRLTNLYLYSEDSMTETEFILKKTELTEQLDDIREHIGFINSGSWEQTVSDEIFIQRASEFIISQRMTDRQYVNFSRLSESVDRQVLKSFVDSIVDSIIIEHGKIRQVVFKNGLTMKFRLKQK